MNISKLGLRHYVIKLIDAGAFAGVPRASPKPFDRQGSYIVWNGPATIDDIEEAYGKEYADRVRRFIRSYPGISVDSAEKRVRKQCWKRGLTIAEEMGRQVDKMLAEVLEQSRRQQPN
jgi:hypothetical protein